MAPAKSGLAPPSGKPRKGARASETHRAPEHVGGELGEPGELAAAARQHDVLGGLGGMTACREPPAHQVENLLDARADDDGELGLGDLVHAAPLLARPRSGR